MVKLVNGATWTTRYMHRDNLGSVTAITDEAGVVIERLAYEPFGKRRFANGATDPNNTILPQNTDRGFTNHEHLDELSLIHMNGRVYDPVAGRFMSADPMIQDSMNLQSYNRYAYVMNNPLLYTDPSGYLRVFGIKITPKVIVAAVVSYYTAGAVNSWMMGNALAAGPVTAAGYTASTITAGIASGAAAGFTSSMVMTNGDVGASLRSAASGAIGGGVSAYYGSNYSIERVASNTFAGGVQSVIRGGSFSDGARSSFTNFAFAYLNVQMRSSMIEQSKNALNGEMLNDGTGLSRGLFGDGFKLAGGRWDPFLSKDEVQCSLLGCLQSGAGKIFGIPYSKGGFVDMVTESFAGPHDKANSRWFYRLDGYIREGTNSNLALDLATNYTTSLAFALPFAAGAIYEQTNAASFVAVPK